MTHNLNKKLGIFGVMVFLLGAYYLIPPAMGLGGQSIDTAPTLTPGTYSTEYLPDGNCSVYYNVTCKAGDNLTVLITHASTLSAKLMAPNGSVLEAKYSGPGWVILTYICFSNDQYIIEVYNLGCLTKVSGSTAMKADIPFSLTIWLFGDEGGIPGFELLAAFCGCLTLLGVALLSRRRKLSL